MPLFEVDATAVEPEFQNLYTYLFDPNNGGFDAEEMDRPVPNAIFVVNFDKVLPIFLDFLCLKFLFLSFSYFIGAKTKDPIFYLEIENYRSFSVNYF